MKLDHTPDLLKVPGLVRGFRLVNVANKALPSCKPMTRRGEMLVSNIIIIITNIITIIIVIITYPFPSPPLLPAWYLSLLSTCPHLIFTAQQGIAHTLKMRKLRPLLDKGTQTVSSRARAFRHYPLLPPYI